MLLFTTRAALVLWPVGLKQNSLCGIAGGFASRVALCYWWWVARGAEPAMLPSVIWSCSQGVSGSALQSGHTAERQKFVLCMQVYRVGRMEADSGRCTSDQMLCHAHRTPQRWAWRADHTPWAYKPQHQKTPSGLPCRTAPWSDFLVCTCIQIQLSSYHFY